MGALGLLTVLLAQAPAATVGVALTSDRPGTEAVAATVATRAHQAMGREVVAGLLSVAETRKKLQGAGFSDPRKCSGARKCLRDLALILGPHAVLIGVDVARLGEELVVHVEAIAADAEAPLAVKDFTVRLKGHADAVVAPLTALAREVGSQLAARAAATEGKVAAVPPTEPEPEPTAPAERPSDAPVAEVKPPPPEPAPAARLTPPEPAPSLAVEAAPLKATKVAGAVTLGAAVVAAAVAVTFAVLAANDQSRWEASRYSEGGQAGTTLSAAQADALVAQGNTRYSVALGTGIGAGALAVLGAVLLGQ